MKIGDRVKWSEYALRSLRDYWQRCGREPHKSNAKRGYEKACTLRGTVTEVSPSGITVLVDNGSIHNSLLCMWEKE